MLRAVSASKELSRWFQSHPEASKVLGRRHFCPVVASQAHALEPAQSTAVSSRPQSSSIFDPPRIVRPGDLADVATVIKNWWSFPAVGFNGILEMPVHKFETLTAEIPEPVGAVVVPGSIFGLPLRKDIIHTVYWWHRRKLAGFDHAMQLYRWEWPGSNRKLRSQKKSGKGRIGRRKVGGRFDGAHAHALRPKDWGKTKQNKRQVWLCLKHMLSTKFAQNAIKVVDSFNLHSHKTKHLVQHLRRIVGRRCHSALLVHEGHLDINDNCRWASAHIPAVARVNVEGVNTYNLLKYHQIVITETALMKLIREISMYHHKRGWLQRFATPDGKRAPPPQKVPGWNDAWVAKRERLRNAEFRAKEFYQEQQKWKWSHELKGPLKIPKHDNLAGFRVKDFLLTTERPVWEKLESLYIDEDPLEDELEEEEFADVAESQETVHQRGVAQRSSLIEDRSEIERSGLKALAKALELGAAGRRPKEEVIGSALMKQAKREEKAEQREARRM